MCTNPDDFDPGRKKNQANPYTHNRLINRLEGIKESQLESIDAVALSGGEPTIHPQFLDVLDFVYKKFSNKEIRLLTNARRFAYESFAKQVLSFDNLNIAVSLYGPTSDIHDRITRTKNSFSQAVKGIDNILKHRNENHLIEIRTVISKLSYKYLGQTLSFIQTRFSSLDRVVIIFMEMEGQAEKNLKATAVTYTQTRPVLKKIYPILNSQPDKFRLYHFPLCVLEPKFWPFCWRTLPEEEVSFISICQKCQYKKYCLGIHKHYLKHIGAQEFQPIKAQVQIKEKENDFYHPILEVKK